MELQDKHFFYARSSAFKLKLICSCSRIVGVECYFCSVGILFVSFLELNSLTSVQLRSKSSDTSN